MLHGGVIIDTVDILERLLQNHIDHQDLSNYILQKDIREAAGCGKSKASRKFKELKEEGMIKEHKGKSNILNSAGNGRCKIFIPTLKGIEHGGLQGKFRKITGGSAEESVFRRFDIGLADMHGKLHIKIPIKEIPEDDGLVWKGPNKLNNNVEQSIRYIEKAGDRVTIEKFEGPNSCSITLKPRFISSFQDSPEDLINRFVDVAWAIWQDLEKKGYRLAFPEGPKGEAKFTLKCQAFEKIGFTESKNVLIDYSSGEAELHPQTGDFRANKIMAELLLDSEIVSNKIEKDIFSEEEMVKGLDEIGEYSKMVQNVRETKKRIKKTENKTDTIASHVSDLAEAVNKMMNTIEEAAEPEEKPKIPETKPGDGMYG